jgi:hypothetical protein
MRRSGSIRLWLATAVLLLAATPAVAQFSSSIDGNVRDSSSAVLAAAEVTLTNTGTGVTQVTQSNKEGYYRFSTLPPGTFTLTASKQGFQVLVRENVALSAEQVRTVDLVLTVGQLSETVTVSTEGSVIQLSEAKIATNISDRELKEAPLTGRNILSLLNVTPGVTGVGTAAQTASGTDIFSLVNTPAVNANGQRGDGNAFYVDNTLATSNPDPGVFNLTPNPDSIQELSVAVNDYSAESGRSGSLVIKAITKSGSNKFHGSVFEYHQGDSLTARNVFQNTADPLTGRVVPKFKRDEFGGSFGGPIQQDKWFFFASWDQKRASSPSTFPSTIEHPDFVNFMRTRYPNNLSTRLLTSYPAVAPNGFRPGSVRTVNDLYVRTNGATGATTPLCPSAGPPVAGMPCDLNILGTTINTFVLPDNGLQWNGRLDRYFGGGKDRLYGNFYRKTPDTFQPNIRPEFNTRNAFAGVTNYANIDWTHTVSPTIINEAAVGFTRISGLGVCAHCDIPAISSSIAAFGQGFAPAQFIQNDFHWRDVLTMTRGRHTLKAGADIFVDQENDLFDGPTQRPGYFFSATDTTPAAGLSDHRDSIFDFAQDTPRGQFGINYNLQNGDVARQSIGFRTRNYGFFAQDDIKLRPNLSVNAGLRWDFNSNPYERGGQMTNVILGSGDALQQQIAGASVAVVPSLLSTHRIAYFAPRLSFAWDPTKEGKLSIRGGFGVFYNRAPNIVWSDAIRGNPPFIANITAIAGGSPAPVYGTCELADSPFNCPRPTGLPLGVGARGGAICDPTSGTGSGCSNIGGTDPGLRQAYNLSRFLGVQWAPSANWVFEADYTGSHAVHLYVFTDRNRCLGCIDPASGLALRPNPYFNTINLTNNDGWSYSNGMTFSVLRRFSGSFMLQAAVNLSSTTSVVDAQGLGRDSSLAPVQDPYNLRVQQGPAAYDIPKSFTLHGMWQLPALADRNTITRAFAGDWQLTGSMSLQDGYPYTVLDCNFTADGTGPCPLANVAASYQGHSCDRSQFLSGCLDAGQFPALSGNGVQGNSGRNSFRGPGYANVNLSVAKYFPIPWFASSKSARVQIRGEFYNLFNRVNLNGVDGVLQDGTFGQATQVYFPRTVQIGARMEF